MRQATFLIYQGDQVYKVKIRAKKGASFWGECRNKIEKRFQRTLINFSATSKTARINL